MQEPPAAGTTIGRYLVLEELGRGGMGVVLRAYDPRLQREVALKVIRGATLSNLEHDHMLFEAQAIAKLSHPNVVAVYDVETFGGNVVIAMEYVEGETLGAWIEVREGQPPRSWREITKVFIAAGRGLAAAHAEGLMHRDFKPSNVLVGHDGRVRVTDFGLVQALESSRCGARAGTPRHIAPDQHADDELGPSTDQYAYCVALFEALTGKRVVDGADSELEPTKRLGAPRWSKKPSLVVAGGIPACITAAIERGMQAASSDRWPSMQALLEALSAAEKPRSAARVVAASTIAMLGVSGTAWAGWQQHQAQRCSGAQEHIQPIWNAQRRATIENAMSGVRLGYAKDTWRRVDSQLEDYAASWVAAHRDACESTTVRGEQTAQVLDLRMACLHGAKIQLAAVLDLLSRADTQTVEKAHNVVDGLPAISRCGDVESLDAGVVPPDEDDVDAVEAVRAQIAHAHVLIDAGRYAELKPVLEQILERVDAIGYEPLRVEAMRLAGEAHDRWGRHLDALSAFRSALYHALRSHRAYEASKAAISIMHTLGKLQRLREAQACIPMTEGLFAQVGREKSALHQVMGSLYNRLGLYAESEREYRASLDLLSKAGAPEKKTLGIRGDLATMLEDLGRSEEGYEEQRRVVEGLERLLGAAHPVTIGEMSDLALTMSETGRLDEAEALYRETIVRADEILGPRSAQGGRATSNLANLLNQRERYAEALEMSTRALSFWGTQSDPSLIANGHGIRGDALFGLERFVEAAAERTTALDIRLEFFGENHHMVIFSRQVLAEALHRLDRRREAIDHLRRALQAIAVVEGAGSELEGITRAVLAEILADSRRYDEALAEAAVAQTIMEAQAEPDQDNLRAIAELRDELAVEQAKRR